MTFNQGALLIHQVLSGSERQAAVRGDLKDGQLTRYTRKEGLTGDRVTCIEQTSDGSMWICYHVPV